MLKPRFVQIHCHFSRFVQIKQNKIYFFQRAFTVIELMVTLAIVAVISTVAVPAYENYQNRINTAQAIADIKKIEGLLERYYSSNNRYPPSLTEAEANNILDPWGNPYQYTNLSDPSIRNVTGIARKDRNLVPINSDFDLYSMGKDGRSVSPLTASQSRDDIVRANNGRYVGVASGY